MSEGSKRVAKDKQSDLAKPSMEVARMQVSSRCVLIGLVLIAAVLSMLGVFFNVAVGQWPESAAIASLNDLFNLNFEANAPSWYSSLLWMLAATIACVIAIDQKSTSRGLVIQWFGFSGVCAFLSADEAMMIHEKIGDVISFFSGGDSDLRIDKGWVYSWVYWGVAFLFGFVLLYWRFLLSLPRRVFIQIVIAGIVFVSGALVCETLTTWLHRGKIDIDIPGAMTLLIATEETLEMLGVIILVHALLIYKRLSAIHTNIEIKS